MSKLYVFGIGGTGARVLKSLTMLLAAGVDCGVDTIVPIIIDRDKGNGDYSRTEGLIKSYISVNNIAPKNNPEQKIKNRFFNTDIKLLGNELLLKLDDETKKFEDFIGIDTQSVENRALSQMLFSKNTLSMDTEYGFKGNPNIGSVVLNQFDDKNIFKAFASDFDDGDKIFIISSIFGGTGSSGFPLLRKMLQTPNLKDATGTELPNWGLINTAPIGAISVLPYFNVDKKDNVDSDTFNDKTRAALSYYETENGKLDTLYYIADTNRKAYKYAEGGKEQENDAHFVELSAAMSILDFVNADKKSENFQKDGNGNKKTIYKEFGINSDVKEISFDNLAAETQKLIVNPLSRFMLFSKYMGYTIVKRSKDGKDKFIAEKVSQYDVFDKQNKYQPYAHGRFVGDFRNTIANLESVQKQFIEWLQEMTQQSRKFAPFNLTTDDAFNFVNGNVSLFTKKDTTYKNWAKVDNQLNKQISKTNKSLSNEKKFIELFYRVTEELINQTSQNNGDGSDRYIFRLQNEGDYGLVNTIEHWGVSDMYGEKQRNAIKSSNENSENQPTSIPSPFARIALVKTAFAEVAAYGDRALHAYKKIVSDSLDVAEIFFTYAKWQNKIEIVKWDKDTDLPKLQAGHKILYKTLKTFLESDAVAYNFDKMKCIYILKYKPTGEMIGATSPCTLFFSSANEFNKANEKGEIKNPIDILLSNNHKAYSGIMPLHKRSWEFQKYLYTWVAANNETHAVNDKAEWIFKDFYNYLQAQKDLQPEKVQEIDNIFEHEKLAMENLKNNYNPIAGYEILSKSIYEQKIDENKIIVSDFKVKTTLKNELLPLILPLKGGNGSGYENWSLTETTKWASFIANEKADRNILPDGTRYGWLTRNDFLEDKIICFPYSIQEESFFSGNLKNSTNTYLLPLKEKYFEYFSTEDLKKHITINGGDSTVKITLKIPVHNGEVIFEKEYKESEMTLVKKRDFDCAIFPNVKFENDKLAFYRIGLFSPFSEKDVEYSADFYKGSTRIALNENDWIKRNTSDNENSVCTIYSLNQKTFDHIRIKIDNVNGVLIPLLPKIENTDSFTFAVDFGTTNTHIEYKTSSNHKIRPLDIQSATGEHQIQFLHGKNEAHTLVSDIDFIPKEIGTDTKFKFPVRTALSLSKNRNKSKTISSFVHANIVIPYEKKRIPKYNEVLTQLKWDATEEEMGYFIDSLCFILRNKTILNKGVLDSTKIVWFYPLSMAGTRSKIIAEKWKLAYAKYFLGISVCNIDDLEENIKDILKENIKDLPESVAPFLYYKDDPKYKDAINNLVSIDIGGGTTDVVFVKDQKVEYVTSFRFAANSIFGIGEHITPVVSKYQSEIEGIIEANDPHFNLTNILNSIKASKFGDLASFFFSLSNNEDLKNVEINFNSMLKKDKEQKLVFVLFYASIIYHTAQIMKARELPLPRHITFSGNGSKIVNIVADKDVLAEFSKLIFEKVCDQKYGNSGLDIIQNTVNPKEVTCKGGIKAADKDYVQAPFVPVVLMGTDSTTFASDNDTYSSIDLDKCVSNTNTEVKAFINYVIDDLLMQKYTKGGVVEETFLTALNLNQNTLQVAKDVCEKEEDFVTFTKNGIMGKIESVTDTSSTKIEETFFFYPIACLLNTISTEINKKN